MAELKPTIVVVEMDRPAVLTNIKPFAQCLVASFGGSDKALIELLLGERQAAGKLPFALPESMQAVAEASPDAPLDDPNPLYPLGFGH